MSKHIFAKWSDLTPMQQVSFGNGCGSSMMPQWLINFLCNWWFFDASCRHHDFGYTVGGNEFRRWHCDLQFAKAMIADTTRIKSLHLRALALLVMVLFYLGVALFGWIEFHYGRPRTLEEILNLY